MITLLSALIIYGMPDGSVTGIAYQRTPYDGGCHALLIDARAALRDQGLTLEHFECHEWTTPLPAEGNG